MADVKPILLRPPCALADAMTRAAEEAGVSRQVWMVRSLAAAAAGHMTPDEYAVASGQVDPSDVPLPGV